MKRKWLALLLVIVVIGGVLAWRLSQPRQSDREQIEQVIENIKAGVEHKSPAQVMENISGDYSDNSRLNYRSINLYAQKLLRSMGDIKAEITNFSEPKIEGDTASVNMTVHATAYDGGQPSTNVTGQVTVYFRREGSWRKQWKVIKADGWQPMAGGGFLE